MKPFKRTERLNTLLQRTLSDILLREVKDPRVKGIVITRVKVSADLSVASVYFRIIGDDKNKEEVLSGLKSAESFVKAKAGKELKIVRIPELHFFYDEKIDEYERITKILNEDRKT